MLTLPEFKKGDEVLYDLGYAKVFAKVINVTEKRVVIVDHKFKRRRVVKAKNLEKGATVFISPMLARPLPKNFILEPGMWVAEKKYDGFRLVVEVSDGAATLFVERGVTGWSRYGNIQKLPTHLVEELAKFPNCILDGEAHVPGLRSFGARTLEFAPNLVYSIFDVPVVHKQDLMAKPYAYRRDVLESLFTTDMKPCVELAETWKVNSWDEVLELRDKMWAQDQEGLILKDQLSPYLIGKRPKTWIKIKKLQSMVVRVVGFAESRGEINYRGKYAMAVVQAEDGCITTVKTRNDYECRQLENREPAEPAVYREFTLTGAGNKRILARVNHPDVGRELRIEYQERTPDMSWRHPRWDRWEDE